MKNKTKLMKYVSNYTTENQISSFSDINSLLILIILDQPLQLILH